mgnify:CR=1 FL=1
MQRIAPPSATVLEYIMILKTYPSTFLKKKKLKMIFTGRDLFIWNTNLYLLPISINIAAATA